MEIKEKLDFILKQTNCKNLNQLSIKTKISYQNLYRVFVKNNGNLQSSSLRKILDLSNGKLTTLDIYDINK